MKEETINKLLYLILIFISGAFAGYIYEVIFYYFTEGSLANRGILFGPWLPIYGVGCVLLYYLKPFKKNPLLLFFLCMLVTGVVEYIIGLISIYIFDMRLWDYRGLFMNIQGIVCLRSVVSFGIGGLLFHYLLEPWLEKKFKRVHFSTEKKLATIFVLLFMLDVIMSYFFRNPILY